MNDNEDDEDVSGMGRRMIKMTKSCLFPPSEGQIQGPSVDEAPRDPVTTRDRVKLHVKHLKLDDVGTPTLPHDTKRLQSRFHYDVDLEL